MLKLEKEKGKLGYDCPSAAVMDDSESPHKVQISPPETPVEGKKRFQDLTTSSESIEDYLPGGYHPVHLKDIFKAQYRVVGKLGNGGSSTVWLAFDIK